MQCTDELIIEKTSENFKLIFINRINTANNNLSTVVKIIELKKYSDMSNFSKKQRQKNIIKTLTTHLPVPLKVNNKVGEKILKELEKVSKNKYFM